MAKEILITKASGATEPFHREKVIDSLTRSGASRPTIDKIIAHIEDELREGMSTSAIYKHAYFLLHKLESPVASRYSLKRAVMELGPSGFPFEHFIAEIFRSRGFEAKTNQLVKGVCVEHEIDIAAWNEHKLIMCEAKFHNDLELKSDLKVALYIKSRFDDVRGRKHLYGGKERDVDEFWLITNTKFTTQAIQYGSCSGIKLVGWNHPAHGNLHDMIDDSGLHPLTCLTSLSIQDKRNLFEKGVVLCKTVRENRDILRELGFKDEKIDKIVKESELMCEPRTVL